jgi:hypothetical protein
MDRIDCITVVPERLRGQHLQCEEMKGSVHMKKYSLIKTFTLFSMIAFISMSIVLSFIINGHISNDKLANITVLGNADKYFLSCPTSSQNIHFLDHRWMP